jgi:hypothetical protein
MDHDLVGQAFQPAVRAFQNRQAGKPAPHRLMAPGKMTAYACVGGEKNRAHESALQHYLETLYFVIVPVQNK